MPLITSIHFRLLNELPDGAVRMCYQVAICVS